MWCSFLLSLTFFCLSVCHSFSILLCSQINEHRKVPIVLVANKKDLCSDGVGQVTTEEGMEQARQWGASYIETSAFTGENVEAAFKTFVREVRVGKNPKPPAPTGFCTLL